MMRTRVLLAAAAALLLSSLPAGAAIIACGEVDAVQGGTAVVEVSLQVEGAEQVAGMQNDLTFDPAVFAIENADCVINPAIGPDSTLAKQLSTNSALTNPTRVRNLLVSLENSDPIPSGLLYTCTFAVSPAAAVGDYTLANINVRASDPQGDVVPTTATDCRIAVAAAPTPTPTPQCTTDDDCPPGEVCVDGSCVVATPTATPIGFCEDDEDCPDGQVCVNNRCVTPTPTATPIGFCEDDEDCPDGQVCVNNRCVTPTPTATPIGYCETEDDCPEGQVCVNNMCVTPTPRKGGGGGGCSCEIDPGAAGGWQAGDVLAVLLPALVLALRWRRRAG
jgi:MYXO-CTERM domain-containing protein